MRLRRGLIMLMAATLLLAACGGGDEGTETVDAGGEASPTADAGGDAGGDGSGVPDSPDDGVTAEEIRIGWMGDLTGPTVAAQGLNFAGSEAAVAWYNENGGVLGRELVLIERDDQYGAEEATTNYSGLVNDDRVLAILNMGGSHITAALAPNLEQDGISLIGPAQTTDQQIESPYTFNNLGHYGDLSDVAVAFMEDELGSIEDAVVAVVQLEVPSGTEWATYIQSEVEEAGGTYVDSITLAPAAPDYSGAVTQLEQLISQDGVNFVALHASPSQALGMATEMAGRGVDVPVVGIQGIAASSIYEEGPPEAAGQFYGVHSFLPPPGDCEMCATIQEFVAGTEWEDPSSEINFAHGWLDIMVTVQAIERAAEDAGEVTRESLHSALQGTFETGGLSCEIDWSETNHSPCATPFEWGGETLEPVAPFDTWSDAIDAEYGLFEG